MELGCEEERFVAQGEEHNTCTYEEQLVLAEQSHAYRQSVYRNANHGFGWRDQVIYSSLSPFVYCQASDMILLA